MTPKTVGIIGAGIAGLSTACYAQMNGYQAHVYEMHSRPGGLCTAWERQGYTIDSGIHWLTGSRPGASLYRLWQEIGLIQGLEIVDLEEFTRVEFLDGTTVSIYSDLDRLEEHLQEIAPEDGPLLREFLGAARRLARRELPSDLPPRELMGFREIMGMIPFMVRMMGPMRRWDVLSVSAFVSRIKNQYVREALSQVWLPGMSAFVLLMTLAWFHGRQAGYPVGGSMPMIRNVEKRLLDLGGGIEYRAKVDEILVEEDRVVGVRLADGREERHDVVVSAADAHATIFTMLQGRYVDETIRGWFSRLEPFPPLVFVGVGVARDFSDEPRLVSGASMELAAPITIGEEEFLRLPYRIHNFDPTLAEAGKSVITCMFDVDYDYWSELTRDEQAYARVKKQVADAVVKTLDGRFPGLAEQVEVVDVATPATFERYTGNWRGSFEGWLPTPGTVSVDMRKTLPGLEGFYMAGQWVAPGGGLPAGVMTGRQVVQLMCHRDGRSFTTSVP